jgi:diguanylate cyclase (GGDEF)-like protein
VIDCRRAGTTVVDLGSGAPFAVLGGPPRSDLLAFLPAPAPAGDAVVPVVRAGIEHPWSGGSNRFLAVSISCVGDLGSLSTCQADFVLVQPELADTRRHLHAEAELAALVAYSQARAMEVVALGANDQAHLDHLRDLGVRYGAGPHIERQLAPPSDTATPERSQERTERLRARLAALGSAGDVADAACEHVAALGLLPSVYIERHGLLRCLAQRGYWQVMDGIPVHLGILGRTFRSGRAVHVEAAADGDFIEAIPGLAAEIATPLVVGSRVRGVFSVESTRPFPPWEAHEIERVAAELELALQRVGVHEEGTALHALVRAGAELATLADEEAVAHAAVRLASGVAGTSSAMIAFPGPAGEIAVRAASGPLAPALRRLDPGDLRALAADLGGISSCVSGGDEDGRVHPVFEDIRRTGGTSLGVFPVRCDTADAGLLFAVDQVPGGLEADHREAMELLAGTVARTLDHVRVHAALRFRAERDALTMVGNRGAYDELIGTLDGPQQRLEQLGLLLVDIDRFKQVNDRFGHVVGDQVLVDVAQGMLDCLRQADRLFRIGGDEFAIVVPDIDLDTADDLAHRLVERTRARLATVDAGLSVGTAVRAPGEPIGDCIVRADAALYAAKAASAGR